MIRSLLILDEPTTGVDPLSRRQFWELIEDLRAEHSEMTVIVATAYMDEAERFEYLIAMDAGRVLISDAKSNVLARTKAATSGGGLHLFVAGGAARSVGGFLNTAISFSWRRAGDRGGEFDAALWRFHGRGQCQFPYR